MLSPLEQNAFLVQSSAKSENGECGPCLQLGTVLKSIGYGRDLGVLVDSQCDG